MVNWETATNTINEEHGEIRLDGGGISPSGSTPRRRRAAVRPSLRSDGRRG